MAKEETLKACPFCGKRTAKLTHNFLNGARKAVLCNCCRVRTDYYNTVEEAVAVWNKRAPK